MSEWKLTSLRDAGVKLIDCDHRTPAAVEFGYPYIAIPQMKEGRIAFSDARKISAENLVEWTKKAKPQAHDVILSRRCNPGETAYVPSNIDFALGQNLVILRSNGEKIFPPFLRWIVRSPAWWDQIGKFINVGAIFDSLKCGDVPKFELPLPPLPEQKRIAKILGDLDDKIELNRQMNATLEAMARALFQSWFVDFDPVIDNALAAGKDIPDEFAARAERRRSSLPSSFSLQPSSFYHLFPSEFVESELGMIPKGWEVSRLDVIASVTMDLSPDGESYNADGVGIPLINGPVEFGDYFPVKTKWTEAATRFAAEGDLIFCVRGSTTGRRVVSDGEYGIGRGVCAIRANGGDHNFLYQTINIGLDRLLEKTTGSVFPSLSAPDIIGFSVLKPSKEIVEAYEQTTKSLIQRIQQNHHQSITLATLREELLPKLLSGGMA